MEKNVIYYVCKYTPLELFAGFATDCVRLDPAPVNFDCADACSHPNLCGYGKAILEAVEAQHVTALVLGFVNGTPRQLMTAETDAYAAAHRQERGIPRTP